jgi:hypothetical protein
MRRYWSGLLLLLWVAAGTTGAKLSAAGMEGYAAGAAGAEIIAAGAAGTTGAAGVSGAEERRAEGPQRAEVIAAVEREREAERRRVERAQYIEELISEGLFPGRSGKRPDGEGELAGGGHRGLRRFLLGLLGVSILLLLLYFSSANLSAGIHQRRVEEELVRTRRQMRYDPEDLEAIVREGRYTEAVLYLYRSCIFSLLSGGVISRANLTDRMILSRIAEADRRHAFREISRVAQYILFDDYLASQGDYQSCLDHFRRVCAQR